MAFPSYSSALSGDQSFAKIFLGLKREVKKATDLSTARGKMKGNGSREPGRSSILENLSFLDPTRLCSYCPISLLPFVTNLQKVTCIHCPQFLPSLFSLNPSLVWVSHPPLPPACSPHRCHHPPVLETLANSPSSVLVHQPHFLLLLLETLSSPGFQGTTSSWALFPSSLRIPQCLAYSLHFLQVSASVSPFQ